MRALGILVLIALCTSACSPETTSTEAASVQFSTADGTTVSAADFSGTPLVINMWATNCLPCVKEMPAFEEVASETLGDIAIIGVNVFDDAATATQFAADRGVTYPQFQDEDGNLSTALAVTGLPATAFFDEKGTLIEVHEGAYTADELRRAIAENFPTQPDEAQT